MSDNEYESDEELYEPDESEDEDIIEVTDLPSEDIPAVNNSKFMNILMTNMRYPSKFVVHALIMARVKALFNNARPLCKNPVTPGTGDYNTIFMDIVKMAVDEVMEDRSPMMFDNPITKTQWSANVLDKTLFKKIMTEAIELSTD